MCDCRGFILVHMVDSYDDSSRDDTVASTPADLSDCLPARYNVLSLLGEGGAGAVYLARDSILDKVVAVKKLHNTASQSQAVRFHREAKVLATLNHANIMSALDFGLTEKQEPYLVLDYVKGESLSSWLEQNGPMAIDPALSLFIELADGLAHAHKKGVVHRDIKPSNIMLVEDEKSDQRTGRIVDFGLAREMEGNQELTRPGVGLGTPKYMPPEQIQGLQTDERSDIYSFGCLMFEVLTGTPVFSADSQLAMMSLHLNDPPATVAARLSEMEMDFNPEDIAGLDKIITRSLSKSADDRFRDASALLMALQEEQQAYFVRESERAAQVPELPLFGKRDSISVGKLIFIAVLILVAAVALFLKFAPNASFGHRPSSMNSIRLETIPTISPD